MKASFLTLAERKTAAVQQLRDSCEALKAALVSYARAHGGRFVLYGSVARGEHRFDSDVDVLIDFPEDKEADAWRFLERLCSDLGLKADIGCLRTSSPRFIDHIQCDMKVIS